MPVPREKLDQLFADKEFLALNESEQTQLLDALNEAPSQQTQQPTQPIQQPNKIGFGDVARAVSPLAAIHSMRGVSRELLRPKAQQVAGMLPDVKPTPQAPFIPTQGLDPVSAMSQFAARKSAQTPLRQNVEEGIMMAGDPYTYMAGPMLKGAAPALEAASSVASQAFNKFTNRGFSAVEEASKTIPYLFKGQNKPVGEVVTEAAKGYQKIERNFRDRYSSILSSNKNSLIPNELRKNVASVAEESLRKVSPESPFYNYLKNLKNRINEITGPELHALKQELGSKSLVGTHKAEAGKVYDSISNVLSDKTVYGKPYSDVTFDYKLFLTKEKPYVDSLLYDKADNLTASKLLKPTFSPSREEIRALDRLSNRAGLDRKLGSELGRVKRAAKVRSSVVKAAPWAGGAAVGLKALS